MRILFLGDIVGRPGRQAVSRLLPRLKTEWELDCVVANAENTSGGIGLTSKNALQLHDIGLDVLTSGNHIWKHKDIFPCLESEVWLLRPANYPPGVPGRGWNVYTQSNGELAVINLLGRIFMDQIDCPFRAVEGILSQMDKQPRHILVDFHAEATSEKKAMFYALSGQVSAVIGTHTHVPTADAQISPEKTAYISDVGMCGPHHSVIGMDPKPILKRLRTGLPQPFTVGKGEVVLQGVLLETDAHGRAMTFTPVERFYTFE
ncbi:MAG: TIGR00282 family metallophosphoesterase [Desulfovermiculus sp.]|nr:TIGR00282 family metallophosphoesterase [Desulfovermiculus sp.]